MLSSQIAQFRGLIVVFSITAFLATGCTHTYKQPIHEVDLTSANNKIDMAVTLVITDDYRNAKWEEQTMTDTFVLPIGENLVHHTERLIQSVFVHSVVSDAENKSFRNEKDVKYLLTPRVAYIEQSFGVTAFSKATTSIAVEWALTRTTGEPVWVETINGVGVGQPGNVFTAGGQQKRRFQAALQDLFQKSQEAMLSSPLLRKLQ